MDRYLHKPLKEYLGKKIILLTGPRQCGKTTLSKMLTPSFDYLNYDNSEHYQIIRAKAWDRSKELVILDELHKMKNWKSWLKGIYDVEGLTPPIIVTGSAKMDTYRRVGDSLAGRYFQYRLHPLDMRELGKVQKDLQPEREFESLENTGGFPEPFLEGTQKFYNMWKSTHLDIILRQDLLEEHSVKDIKSIEILIELMRHRVGSTISYSSLAKDLQISDKTIKRWLQILENMYVLFKVTPYSKNISRAHTKQPKYYFYDVARVQDQSAKLENIVASSLLKEIHYQADCMGSNLNLHFLRKKDGTEIDFAISKDRMIHHVIEVKTSDDSLSRSFQRFKNEISDAKKTQLVRHLNRERTFPDGTEIRSLPHWLSNFSL